MTRALAAIPGLALILTAALAWPQAGLGQAPPAGKAKSKPKPADLLKVSPYDRLILIDNDVFDIEPISPRPLPPIDKKRMRQLEEEENRARRKDGAPRKEKEGEDEEPMVIIHLTDGEPRDYKVKRTSIKDVEYFEDMLLAEGDRLIKEKEYARAFERFLVVRERDPNWKGLDDRVNRLLFEEGSASLIEDNARGLRLLTELRERKPDYPGLADRLAGTFGRKIDRAFEVGDFRSARKLLRELERLAPGHSEVKSARGRFEGRAKTLMDSASKASPSDRVDRLAEVVQLWPEQEGLESAYREAFRNEPTLTVAVDDLADPVGPFPTSPSSARIARLLYLPVLSSVDEEAARGEAPGQLSAGIEAVELGRGLKVSLKAGATWSDGSRPVSAIDVARSLADRALPASPGFNARWADLLDRVEVVDEFQVDIRLTRSSMKPETWLLDPVGPAHAGFDGWISSAGQGRRPVGDGLYRWESSTDSLTILHSSAGPAGHPKPKIKRIREVRYPNSASALEALARGEISLIEHVPPDKLADLAKLSDRVKVGRFATPSIHRIALDGRSPALRNRKLRRALSMSIDRKTLLEDVVLKRRPDGDNAVSDGPFVKGTFVDSPGVEPLAYRPLLAKGLVAAARKELGGAPIQLTLEYPSTAEARAACPKIAEAFALIGVEVKLVERSESSLESALLKGRRFDLAYRSSRPTLPLRDVGPMLLPGYDAAPSADALASAASPEILQLLMQLDRAPETTSARALALQIDRESRDELPVLPLWQLEDHYAWRINLRGPAESTDQIYQGIPTWEVEPWFEKDPS